MSRLTKKILPEYGMHYETNGDVSVCQFNNKLGQLEDIEEEIGIDLTILFNALKNGVYYFGNQGQLIHDYVWLINNYVSAGVTDKISFSFMTFSERLILLFKDYGKTFALTKEELENE